jgi:phosphoribosylformylglycinamidine synthase
MASQHLCVTARDQDPRATSLAQSAQELGIEGVTAIAISDLIFLRGDLDVHTRSVLNSLLVDPLLQRGEWDSAPPPNTRCIETSLHPGVTDSATNELVRLAERLGLPVSGVASGKRFSITGKLSDNDLGRLVTSLLANPIIECWSIDQPIEPAFISPSAASHSAVEQVAISASTSVDELALINKQRGLAMDPEEMLAVREHFDALNRLPTDIELETIAQTWSEHCSHKTFRASITTTEGEVRESLINQLRNSTNNIASPIVRSAFVGNAGIISFTPGRTLALKCETHNHPSAVEPFGGANTGVGGVIRDIMGAAHQPVACTNILCFGDPDTDPLTLPDGVFPPRRTRAGVIDGIADYGNKIGLPTVAGAVLYDAGYTANPLVYAGCIGVSDTYTDQVAPLARDRVIVLGGRTGRDGLRGATFSSMTMDATTGDVSGASVQIGDPITEKLLIDLLADAKHVYRSITDCGAGGLSSAIGEMAEGVGADVELSTIPLKYPGLAPWEIWLSEAQERMVVAVDPKRCAELQALCQIHGVEYTDAGEFTGDNQLVVRFRGEPVLQLNTDFLHNGRPQRKMIAQLPQLQRELSKYAPTWLTKQQPVDILLALLGHPNIANKASVIHRYDHEIRGATAVRPLVGEHGDGHGDGVVIAEPTESFGFALGIGVNPWFGVLDPEAMALGAIDEAMRNVVCVGADPSKVALLDNFSWGDPRRQTTLGELVAAVDGCCAGANAFGAPFVSGKDSLNNEYFGADGERHSVPPTLVITAVAHVPDANNTVTADAKQAGNLLFLLGTTKNEFGASHAQMVCGQPLHGTVPQFDSGAPQRYAQLHQAMKNRLVVAAHDCSEGGVAVTLAEMAMAGRLGIAMHPSDNCFTQLFSESLGRIVIEVQPQNEQAVRALFEQCEVIATVVEQPTFTLSDGSSIALSALLTAWQAQ